MNALTSCGLWKGATVLRIWGFTYEPDGVCRRCERAKRLGNGLYVLNGAVLHLLRAQR